MDKLQPKDLYSLEQYALVRPEFRAKVMAHKKNRHLPVGPAATLYFEDRLTIHYQVQEMLRAERIFEQDGIREELDAYNPLIPDGSNWKATFMVEIPDPDERRVALARLVGVEDRIWVQVDGEQRVYAISDEDLDRATEEKTSSVHFMRFELTPGMRKRLDEGARLAVGCDLPAYRHSFDEVPEAVRESLLADLS